MTDKDYGYTTGTYAAAATKGALMLLLNAEAPDEVTLKLPGDDYPPATIPVTAQKTDAATTECSVVKVSVEDNDATDKMEIIAAVSLRDDSRIIIDGGRGIGRITRPGLQLEIGQAAINPAPRKMIKAVVQELTDRGADVTISAPGGAEAARATYNSRLGITGGISIIGTTGIMRAKSAESFKDTIGAQIRFCKENNFKEIVITPGNISEEAMLTQFAGRITKDHIIQSGDHLGFTLRLAKDAGLGFVLAGHPGKLAKTLNKDFQTHFSRSGPANNAVINLLKDELTNDIIDELKDSPTVEGITNILIRHRLPLLLDIVAEAIEKEVREYLGADTAIPTILFNMDKELIGASEAGRGWIEPK
ncbi:Cobalt-precorrin-5B (C1)-methyltransferase [hydrothermal vent metagenome]|uniref:Cobalt-precorrin-5B (C1)-methyltransferase n=1 Tax=hydrothermal vent metagenome TaxID=652676 RepID=A0A3B0RKC6_9ZZZZ